MLAITQEWEQISSKLVKKQIYENTHHLCPGNCRCELRFRRTSPVLRRHGAVSIRCAGTGRAHDILSGTTKFRCRRLRRSQDGCKRALCDNPTQENAQYLLGAG